MKKRLIAVVLALCITSSNTMGVFAASTEGTTSQTTAEEAVEVETSEENSAEDISEDSSEEEISEENTGEEISNESSQEPEIEQGDGDDSEQAEEDEQMSTDTDSSSDMIQDEEDVINEEDSAVNDHKAEEIVEETTNAPDSNDTLKEEDIAVADLEEVLSDAKEASDEVNDSFTDAASQKSGTIPVSAQAEIMRLCNYIVDHGTKIQSGWKLTKEENLSGATVVTTIIFNVEKEFVRFQLNLTNESSGLKSAIVSMDYDIESEEYLGVDVYVSLTSLPYFTATADIDPESYYPKQELAFKKLSSLGISDEYIHSLANSYTEVAFAGWAVLLAEKPVTYFPWIGFPKYCLKHTWSSEYTVDKEPTYTEEGSESIHCIICDEIQEGSERPIEKLIKTGWSDEEVGRVYRKEDGTLAKGWQTIDGEKYYFDDNGAMHIGWLQQGDKWYYFRLTGVMHTGMLKKDGIYYYLEKSGVRHSGWLQVNGKLYYFKTNGQMLTGWLQKSGKMYYFKTNGEMLTGWLQKNGKKFYFRTNGQMLTGWLKLNGKYYYFKENGQMVTGRYKIGNQWFTFNSNGVRQ